MILRLSGDLHCDWWNYNKINKILNLAIPKLETDKETVLCLSGDIGQYHKKETWLTPIKTLSKRFKAVVWVAGNHFYYRNNIWGNESEIKKLISTDNVYFLENEYKIIDDVVFIGATFWTNFDHNDPFAIFAATKGMNDYYLCKKQDGSKLTAMDTYNAHAISEKFIFNCLDMFKDRKCVVISHHAPSELSVHEQYKGSTLNYAYYSEYSYKIAKYENLAIFAHGHTHNSFDYMINKTRVICNPFGYFYGGRQENINYNPSLILEI